MAASEGVVGLQIGGGRRGSRAMTPAGVPLLGALVRRLLVDLVPPWVFGSYTFSRGHLCWGRADDRCEGGRGGGGCWCEYVMGEWRRGGSGGDKTAAEVNQRGVRGSVVV